MPFVFGKLTTHNAPQKSPHTETPLSQTYWRKSVLRKPTYCN